MRLRKAARSTEAFKVKKGIQKTASTHKIGKAVEDYERIRAKIRFYESLLKEPVAVIKAEVEKAPNLEIITEKYKITYHARNGESFDLKLAKEKLGEKVLSPFLSSTSFHVLLIN